MKFQAPSHSAVRQIIFKEIPIVFSLEQPTVNKTQDIQYK